jgi:hypothetical protein
MADTVKFLGDLEVAGKLTVTGEVVSENVANLLVKDALIVANSDGTDVGTSLVGTVYRLSEDEAYAIAYDKTTDAVRLGKGTFNTETKTFTYGENEGLPVAIRDLTDANDDQILVWDKNKKAVVSSGKTIEQLNPTIDKVIINKNLVFTEVFGKYGSTDETTAQSLAATGKYTLNTNGQSLLKLLENAFASDTNPTIIQPSITFAGTNLGAKEVGTKVKVGYNFTNATSGEYQFGPDTGVTWSGHEATFNGTTLSGISGTFAEIQVTDATNLTLTGKATHSDGAVPKTALNNNYTAGKIAATTKDYSYSTKLTGYRNMFAGTMTSKPATMTSANIRALANTKKTGATTDWSIVIPAGAMRVVIAVPNGRTLSKVLDSNDSNANIVGSFTSTTVKVEGANGYNAIDYTVYYMDAANALKANTYKVTIV